MSRWVLEALNKMSKSMAVPMLKDLRCPACQGRGAETDNGKVTCISKNCSLFALAVPIALWERVGQLGSPNSVAIIQERSGSNAGKVVAAFPTVAAAKKLYPYNEQVFEVSSVIVGKGLDDPAKPVDLDFDDPEDDMEMLQHVWVILQKTSKSGNDYVVGVWGSEKAAKTWCKNAGATNFRAQRMEIQGPSDEDWGSPPTEEVCYCGMLISEHDATSSCTTPYPFPKPEEWPGERVFLEKAQEHLETSTTWDQDDDQEFDGEERAANSRQELRDAMLMLIQYMKSTGKK